MNRLRLILAPLAVLVLTRSSGACGYGMPSPAARFVLAHTVVVGKVIAVDHRTIPLHLPGSPQLVPHVVGILKIEATIKGDDRLTHLRLAMRQHQSMPVGYEGCFFLTAHCDEPVFLMSSGVFDYPIQKAGNSGFAQQVEQFKKLNRLLSDPLASLTSRNAEDRFLTAALLVTQFRSLSPEREGTTSPQQQPVNATVSKLILRTLAECDWNRSSADFRLLPARIFSMLGVTEKDGLNLRTPDPVAEVKRWLRDNEETFRIKAFVR